VLVDPFSKGLENLAKSPTKNAKPETPDIGLSTLGSLADTARPDRHFSFSKETLNNAKRLGLVAARVEGATEYAQFCQHAWQAGFQR
jgi:hypothetical protein